jgi:hypothetical protein
VRNDLDRLEVVVDFAVCPGMGVSRGQQRDIDFFGVVSRGHSAFSRGVDLNHDWLVWLPKVDGGEVDEDECAEQDRHHRGASAARRLCPPAPETKGSLRHRRRHGEALLLRQRRHFFTAILVKTTDRFLVPFLAWHTVKFNLNLSANSARRIGSGCQALGFGQNNQYLSITEASCSSTEVDLFNLSHQSLDISIEAPLFSPLLSIDSMRIKSANASSGNPLLSSFPNKTARANPSNSPKRPF